MGYGLEQGRPGTKSFLPRNHSYPAKILLDPTSHQLSPALSPAQLPDKLLMMMIDDERRPALPAKGYQATLTRTSNPTPPS